MTQIFDAVVELKREFLRTQAEISAYGRTMPLASEIISGEKAITEEQHRRWDDLWTRQQHTALEIHRLSKDLFPAERLQLDAAASAAAKAQGSDAPETPVAT